MVPFEQQTNQQAIVTCWLEVFGEGSIGSPKRSERTGKVTHRGGMSPSRIVQSVMPLIEKHGREHVLRNFRRYLTGRDRRFATPEDFASKYGAWAKSARIEPARSAAERVDEHVAQAMASGVDMDRALDEMFPRKRGKS